MLPILTPTYELLSFLDLDNWPLLYSWGAGTGSLGMAAQYVRVEWLNREFGI